MSEAIWRAEFLIETEQGHVKLTASIQAPFESGADWSCTVSFSDLRLTAKTIHGATAQQVLELSKQFVKTIYKDRRKFSVTGDAFEWPE
jgi:hypothetical protein